MQKLAKRDNPVFLAIVRTNETPVKRKNISQCREAKFAAAHEITEGQKRQINKRTGPKNNFAPVEERERQVLQGVPDQHRQNLRSIINEYKDVFPEKLPKGVPP